MRRIKEENQKIIEYSYCQWKNLPTWTKDRERKNEIDEEERSLFDEGLVQKGTWMMRDLVRIRFCVVLQESNCQWSTTIQTPQRFLHQRDRSLATYWLLALELHWLGFFLVASSLSPHLTRFLVRLVGWSCFCLRGWVGLTVGWGIGGAVSIAGEVAVALLGWSL